MTTNFEVVGTSAAAHNVYLQNIGIKNVKGSTLPTEATNPCIVYYIEESKVAVVYCETPGAWFSLDGYIAAATTALRNIYPSKQGQMFYNLDLNIVEQFRGETWQAVTTSGVFSSTTFEPVQGIVQVHPAGKYLATTSTTVMQVSPNALYLEGHTFHAISASGWAVTATEGARVLDTSKPIITFNPADGSIVASPYVILSPGLLYTFILQGNNQWMCVASSNFNKTTTWDISTLDPSIFVTAASRTVLGKALDEVPTVQEAYEVLELGNAALRTVGTGASDLPNNTILDQKLAGAKALVERGVTGEGQLVALGYAGVGVTGSVSNWDAATTGISGFMAGATGSPVDEAAMAGISVVSSSTFRYGMQLAGYNSRLFCRTFTSDSIAPFMELLTVRGFADNNATNVYGNDANDYKTIGSFSVTSVVANLPVAVDGTLRVGSVVKADGGVELTQEFMPYTSTVPKHYFRAARAGLFSQWSSALLSASLGTAAGRDVGQTAGNVQEVGSFGGPTGNQTYYHTGNMKIMTSLTDTTAGALMPVGAFGIGTVGTLAPVPVTDLNNLNISGSFDIRSPLPTNWPFSGGGSLRHICHGATGDFIMQEAISADNQQTMVRYRRAAGWQPWKKVLVAGDFGIGAVVPDTHTVPLNDLIVRGTYNVSGGTADWPFGGSGGTIAVDSHGNNSFVTQTAHSAATNLKSVRFKSASTWSRWFTEYSQANILGTVLQSGGVPTGAIIQRGGNANGQYTALADGTQFCWHIAASTTTPSTPYGSLFTTNSLSWTYPIAFADANVAFFPAVHSGAGGDFTWAGVGDVQVSATSATYRAWRPVSVIKVVVFSLSATGRWYN